jgi:hypothetical protein
VFGETHAGPHDAMTPPHPSPADPHVMLEGQVVAGLHGGAPQWNATPEPPHVSGAVHAGHVTNPPHPSPTEPHWMPASSTGQVVMGTHDWPHSKGTPPPPHVWGETHVPHV